MPSPPEAWVITEMNRLRLDDSNNELDAFAQSAETLPMEKPDLVDIYLERIDPDQNMARFYALSVRPNLFGELSLIRMYGRLDTVGHTMIDTFADIVLVKKARTKLLRQKLRRGYRAGAASRRSC